MKYKLFLFVLISAFAGRAQNPHISGTVSVSIKNGTIAADLMVSNLPRLGNAYALLLNSGMNIRYIRDSADRHNFQMDRYYDDNVSGEAFAYYLPGPKGQGRFLPKAFRISYVGAFPVISDTLKSSNTGDWKGNIAFNGDYLRASEQTAWYPVLYDTVNDIKYDKVTYDLKITCDDGNSIYVNGSDPVHGSSASLSSKTPVELLLFVGNYEFNKKGRSWFVNSKLNEAQQDVLSSWTGRITSFYEKKLKAPYGYAVTYVGATPLSKKQAWLFVTYPSIVIIGREPYDFKGYFDVKTAAVKDSSDISFIAHELGHYYFGTYFVPNAELNWMFLEGITEYISLKAVRDLLGERFYSKAMAKYVKQVEKNDFIPLNLIKNPGDIGNNYRYNYVPLLLSALEKQIGEESMWKWLNTVFNSKNVKSNYDFFRSSLLQSGVPQKQIDAFESTYITSPDAKKNVIARLN
ncbi:MAG: hypothetical protein ACXVP0_06105 [Bacteroidia bacterium]